ADWQLGRLRELIDRVRDRVPHYRRSLEGFDTRTLRSPSDLALWPMVHRQQVRAHERDFVDERLDLKKVFKEKTSGSTGASVTVYWPIEPLRRLQAAIEVRVRNAAGVSRSVPRAMLGGRPIVPGD